MTQRKKAAGLGSVEDANGHFVEIRFSELPETLGLVNVKLPKAMGPGMFDDVLGVDDRPTLLGVGAIRRGSSLRDFTKRDPNTAGILASKTGVASAHDWDKTSSQVTRKPFKVRSDALQVLQALSSAPESVVKVFLRLVEESAAEDWSDLDSIVATLNLVRSMPAPDLVATHAEVESELGPFYSTSSVTDLLGVSRQALERHASASHVLVVRFGRQRTYPKRQFDAKGHVISGLPECFQSLAPLGGFNTWAWLMGTLPQFGGLSNLQVIANGDASDVAEVQSIARQVGAQWPR